MKENDLSEKETNLNEKLIQFNNQKQQTTSNRPTLFHEIIIKIFPCLHHVDQLSKKHIFLKESELSDYE